MRILVTGGTGFVGRAIVHRLVADGHQVAVSTRRRSAKLPLGILQVGSLVSLVQQPAIVQGFDALIHLIGIISEVGAQTFESVHVDGTRMALRVAELAGIPRFLHMSALGTRENARSRYHQSKWRAEEYVRSSSTAWTLFRPSIVYGRDDQFVNLFARISRQSPFVPVIGKGANKFQPIGVDEVAHCFVAALKNPASISRTYDLCGIDAIDFRGLLGTILRVTGRHRKLVSLPLPAARFQATIMETLFSLIRKPSPLTRDQIIMLGEDNIGNPLPAMEAFGFSLTPFEEGVRRMLMAKS